VKKIDLVFVAAILATAAALRLSAPWDDVLGSSRVNFLETDAWYHVRLVENQVRNFPHRVTVDPYAAPTGQYVAALAPVSNPTPWQPAFPVSGVSGLREIQSFRESRTGGGIMET